MLTGTSLGPYRVGDKLGEGGMGQVYRATDTNLKRQVALKVLPPSVATDAERVARFQREAEVLAALNHPNIAAIYGLERSGVTTALVMELVDGPTLADHILRGALPLDEVVPIARQIADALEAAHEQGIIHRDLKPANIKVRDDGTVKVLDFGLAKLTEGPATADGPDATGRLSQSPTVTTPAVTSVGVILGTAAYMSPEQAKGKTVDRRADIWAFGAVLYEMLTGQRAFHGGNISETLAAVIAGSLKYDGLAAGTPPRLKRLLRRCLERDVRMRLRDIGEARVELVALESGATREETATSSRAPRPVRAAWIGRFQLMPPEGVDLPQFSPGSIGISPDGCYIVFAASGDGKQALWLRPLDATDSRLLPGTEGGVAPFWSPDSAFLAFFASNKLKRIQISTNDVQVLCEASDRPGGGAWSRDGVIVFAPMLEGPLFRVPACGGAATPLTTLNAANQESNHTWPAFLPDGRHYVFQVFGLANAGIYLGVLDSPERVLLIHQESLNLTAVQYAPSGHLLYVSNHTLVAHPFNARLLRLNGEAFPLAQGFGPGGAGMPAFGVSDNGVLVFRAGGRRRPTFQPTWFRRDGTREGTLGPPGPYGSFDLSADGHTLALEGMTETGLSIWLVDARRGTATRFTADAPCFEPRWSPQGDRLVFESVRDTPPNPFVRTLAGVERRLARLPAAVRITSWAPDGTLLIGEIVNVGTGADLWLFSASGETAPIPFLQTPFNEWDAHISPHGHWVAFASDEGVTHEIYLTTFPEVGRLVRVSTVGGETPRWRDDGKELFFQQKDKLMAVSVATEAAAADGTGTISCRVGLPRELFTLPAEEAFWVPAKGGRRFLVSVTVTKPVPAPIQVVINWNARAAVQR